MPQSDVSTDPDKVYSDIKGIFDDFKKMQKTVKEQQEIMTSQSDEIKGLRQCLETQIIKIIYNNIK